MVKNTQDIASLIVFEDLIAQSLKESMIGFETISIYKAVLLLALSTGLEMSLIFTLKWKDLLSLGSENEAVVRNELAVRKYIIPIHPKIKKQLSEIYTVLGFPKLDAPIIEKLALNATVEHERLPEYIIRSINSNRATFLKMSDAYLSKFNFNECTQVYFGRRVFEVCGYSNKVSRDLKQHFGFRQNKDLFDFLGYMSKEEIIYELSHINLDCHTQIKFIDKNFNDGFNKYGMVKHPFQKFTAFSRFLKSGKTYYSHPVTNSVRLLLLLSLYNGVRPSTLVRLKWKDIMIVDKTELSVEICGQSVLEGYIITIEKDLRDKFLYHFELITGKIDQNILEPTENRYLIKGKVKYISHLNLDSPVFVSNTGNPITQPSLAREIKNTLTEMGFPHTDKFTSKSTSIMYGRRILEIKGYHKPTVQKLKEHFNFKSESKLFDFLYLDNKKDGLVFEGRMRKNMFEEILYDL